MAAGFLMATGATLMSDDGRWARVHVTRQAFRMGAPWAALVVGLWLLQVWSIWGSPFSMEVTLLQGIFVLVFVVVIFLIAQARLEA